MEIREIQFGSEEYAFEVELRSKCLREPLGLRFTADELSLEKEQVHLGAFEAEALLGCLLLVKVSNELFKMRQVAVAPPAQGRGIGKQLVAHSETLAQRQGVKQIELHARTTAVPFYLALGYEIEGEPFEEVSIPHRKMSKRLFS